MRERFINYGTELSLTSAIDITRAHESAQQQLNSMDSAPVDIETVNSRQTRRFKPNTSTAGYNRPNQSSKATSRKKTCGNCEYSQHVKMDDCSARNRTCNKCKRRNHFAALSVARRTSTALINQIRRTAIATSTINSVLAMLSLTRTIKTKHTPVTRNNTKLKLKIDTCAQVDILHKSAYDKLRVRQKCSKVQRSNVTLHGCGVHTLKSMGMCQLRCSHKRKRYVLQFQVIDARKSLGLTACVEMGVVQLVLSGDGKNAMTMAPTVCAPVMNSPPVTTTSARRTAALTILINCSPSTVTWSRALANFPENTPLHFALMQIQSYTRHLPHQWLFATRLKRNCHVWRQTIS